MTVVLSLDNVFTPVFTQYIIFNCTEVVRGWGPGARPRDSRFTQKRPSRVPKVSCKVSQGLKVPSKVVALERATGLRVRGREPKGMA